jgi:hemoglobin
MSEEEELFARLGGASRLSEIVGEMYERVLDDPELSGFFKGVSTDRLHKMQFQFLASAFGGPVQYTGAELTQIHKPHAITGKHFAKFCGHFADAMDAKGIAPRDVDDALGRLAIFKDKVTGESNVDG